MKGDSSWLLRWRQLGLKNDELCWIDLCQRHRSHAGTMFAVQMRDQASGKKYSKGSRQPEVTSLQKRCAKRPYHDASIFHPVKFASTGASRKPVGIEIAGLARLQFDEGTIELSL